MEGNPPLGNHVTIASVSALLLRLGRDNVTLSVCKRQLTCILDLLAGAGVPSHWYHRVQHRRYHRLQLPGTTIFRRSHTTIQSPADCRRTIPQAQLYCKAPTPHVPQCFIVAGPEDLANRFLTHQPPSFISLDWIQVRTRPDSAPPSLQGQQVCEANTLHV